MKIDGGCHCGYITYEAEADPQKPFICHCTDCQQLSGSASRIGIRVASDDFRMLSGEPTIYAKTAAYGHFGRDEHSFTWERTDKAQALREAAGLAAITA